MLLSLKNVCYDYQDIRFFGKKKFHKRILHNIDFCIDTNERVGIMGVNGCGKSTLARIIAGLQAPTSGQVLLNDSIIETRKLMLYKARQIAFYRQVQIIFQDPISSFNPRFTIAQILEEPLRYLLGITNKQAKLDLIMPLLFHLELDSNILHSYPTMISGGQLQRINLIRALLVKPSVLILDEVTSNLDYVLAIKMLDFLKDWQIDSPCAMLYITHDMEFAINFCNRLLTMGNIANIGNGIISEKILR